MGDREYNTDYLWHMKYRNDLPEIPVGPFLVEIPKLLHPLEHYGTYYQSSIEKNYVWRPHFPEAGIQVDLWDKESLIVPQDAALRGSLDLRDLKYIQEGQEGSGGRKAASKDIERPWWLRNTTYLEVVSSAEGQKKEELRAASHRSKQPTDPSSVVNIFEKSFHDMDSWKSKQITQPDPDIVAVHPIFPDEGMIDSNVTMGEFLVNPEYLRGTEDEGTDLSDNILTNVRMNEGTLKGQSSTFISLVAKNIASGDDESKDMNLGESTSTEYGDLYSHVKDFRTELEADSRTFLWYFDDENKEMKFLPIISTVRMKRVSNEDASWHDVYVKRRKQGEPEEELPDDDEGGVDEQDSHDDEIEADMRVDTDPVASAGSEIVDETPADADSAVSGDGNVHTEANDKHGDDEDVVSE